MKKKKLIDLSDAYIKQLSKDAIDKGMNFKNYVQDILEAVAVKAVRQKKKN